MMAAINRVNLSEAVAHNRFSAEFFDPRYVFKPASQTEWIPIGRVLKKCEYGLSISMNSAGKGFPIFRMNELDDCFASRPAKYADVSTQVFLERALKENDVLFNRTNSFEFVGRTGIVKDQTDCTFASYLIRLVPDPARLLPEFLTAYLNTHFGIGQIKRRAMRSINQANVSGSEVKKILIPLPGIAAQQEIADLVNTACQKKSDSAGFYASAQQLLESELGLDKLTFQKPVDYSARFSTVNWSSTFSAGRVDAQCFAPDALLYESWLQANTQCVSLGSLLKGTAKGRQQIENDVGVTDYCSIKHIAGRELLGASKCCPQSDAPMAGVDDLLLAITGATIGKIGIVKRYAQLAFSGDLLCLRVAESIDPHYLLLTLDHKIGQVQFNRWITGSTNGHLAPKDVARVLVPRLSKEAEAQIAELVRTSLAKRQESERLLNQAKTRVEQLIEAAVQP